MAEPIDEDELVTILNEINAEYTIVSNRITEILILKNNIDEISLITDPNDKTKKVKPKDKEIGVEMSDERRFLVLNYVKTKKLELGI